jgi:hypothetical protein
MDRVEARGGGLCEMRERHFRKPEARSTGVAHEGRLQNEECIGCGNAIERRVERRNEERIPEGATLAGALIAAPQPLLEGFALVRSRRRGEGAGDAEFFAEREKRIRREGLEQVQRRGEQAGAQATAAAVARENPRVEAILQAKLVRHADALRECNELAAAGEKDVLSVIDLDAVDFKRRCAPSKQTPALEELDAGAGFL